ncbi:MAG: HDIG domain-containing protein [Planctomycetes bacterium]|nr:HDIG domain-containing protein [Planctomycetota bacterium]
MDRSAALELLHEYTQSGALRAHALGVEAAMRAMARASGEDEDRWGLAGLLHDFDYEMHPTPEEHPLQGAPILRERGVPEAVIQAILGHGNHTGVPRDTPMARALFGVDELVGFITAVALVRPSRKVRDVTAASVRKKMKDKAFARSVSRADILQGAEELGVELDRHVELVVDAMAGVADQLGL